MSLSTPTVDFAISQQGRPSVILLQRLPKPPNLHLIGLFSLKLYSGGGMDKILL